MYIPTRIYVYPSWNICIFRPECMYIPARIYVYSGQNICIYIPARIYVYIPARIYVYSGQNIGMFRLEYMYVPARIYVCPGQNICMFRPESNSWNPQFLLLLLVRPSQKASSGDISGTKHGIIDPLVSKRPEKILNKKIKKKYEKKRKE